jgi:hypothetical protein
MRLAIAFRAFFSALFSADAAGRIGQALVRSTPTGVESEPAEARQPKPEPPKRPVRSEAVSLLAALQREARFIDLVQESLEEYSDQQVGAAARDVLRDCRGVLDRLFALRPVMQEQEGASIQVAPGFDTGQIRLTGNVAGEPPFEGNLAHHGWQATQVKLPSWSGSDQAARVVAPAEVELA